MNNFRSSVRRGACLTVIIAILGGCAVGPNFVRPAPPDTDCYTREPRPEATVAADGQAQHFTPGAAITAGWWQLFKSAQLDAVVRQAIANNQTLLVSEASLRQSQDNLRAGYGVFFPQIQAGLDVSRQRTAPLLQGSQTPGTIFNLVTLSGTYGVAGSSLGNLSAGSGKFWSIGPSVTTPVFQGTSLWYSRCAAIDAYQQSQANYRQTVLGAFGQVADSLKALQRTAGEAPNLLQANYRAGLVAYLDVLTADVQFHKATIAYLQAVAQRHQDTVALFVALGGGWWSGQRSTGEGEAP